jgi:hypothetical protein
MSRMIQLEDGLYVEPAGYAALWRQFGLSYASWLVMPRALMHEMPDTWQASMAVLMAEYFETYKNLPSLDYEVKLKSAGKYVGMPDWVQYRHPDVRTIESFKGEEK